jgi:hypothetical protein
LTVSGELPVKNVTQSVRVSDRSTLHRRAAIFFRTDLCGRVFIVGSFLATRLAASGIAWVGYRIVFPMSVILEEAR